MARRMWAGMASVVVVVASCAQMWGLDDDYVAAAGVTLCDTLADCSGNNTDCAIWSCDNGTCAPDYAPAGTACPGSMVCDGQGNCVECASGDDCASSICEANACVPASCVDMKQNGDETDVDCGGGCPKCDDGEGCVEPTDCLHNLCVASTCEPCSDDADCADDALCQSAGCFCQGGGCVDKLLNGDSCIGANQCVSANCVDGFCCDTPCASLCEACNQAGGEGICAPHAADSDPEGDCVDQGAASCGVDGTGCSGSAACKLYPVSTVCGVASCAPAMNEETAEPQCDGLGTCVTGNATSCAPYLCNPGNTACLASCGDDMDCVGTHYCGGPSCVMKKTDGSGCIGGNECMSNICIDDVCCGTPCDGTCESCNQAGNLGTCTQFPNGSNPGGECTGAMEVCVAGVCKVCGAAAAPPGGACPPQCANNCAGNICIIACDGTDECKQSTINCPAGFACQVECTGSNGCDEATINCPDTYACNVECNGTVACKNAEINCGTGICDLTCQNQSDVCQTAQLNCGEDQCTATCNGTPQNPSVDCNDSCGCTEC